MIVNVRNVLSLLIISTLIHTVAITDGADNTRTIDSIPILPVVTPNDTSVPNATSVPMSTVTTIVTPIVTPIIAPNITSVPNATSVPTPIVTPMMTPNVISTSVTSVSTPIVTPIITPNITSVSNTNATENETQKIVPEVVILVVTPNVTSVPNTISEKTTEATPTNGAAGVKSDGSGKEGFFGDIYDKIIIAAILGFIGLIYEIVKIKYEHKQKAKTEQLREDEQNRLLEKLERRQRESSQQATHSGKQQDNLSDSLEEKENISKKGE